MATDLLYISLFGRFSARYRGQPFAGWEAQKVKELLAYLLLHAGRPHYRELLASLLWGEHCTTRQSLSYLRKALWKLQSALHAHLGDGALPFLKVESDWVRFDLTPPLHLDVALFEKAEQLAEDRPGRMLSPDHLQVLKDAVALYKADLLEGWPQEWCTLERERMRHLLLVMLDKLMAGCEAQGDLEAAIAYGHRTLREDRARECTHRRLMYLYLRKGDRTGALRQYLRCERALAEELDVAPSRRTLALYEDICNDAVVDDGSLAAAGPPGSATRDVQQRLKHLQRQLSELQKQVDHTLQVMDEVNTLRTPHST